MGELSTDNSADASLLTPVPVGTKRRAIRTVCANARDRDDALDLIDALDLTDALGGLAELRALGRGDRPVTP